jgi:hypothetical protein
MITGTRSVTGVPLAQKQARDRRRRRRKQNRKRPSDAEASATATTQPATIAAATTETPAPETSAPETLAPKGNLRGYKRDATVIGFNSRPKPYADLAERLVPRARRPSQVSGRRPPRVDIRV